ncbi:MAG: phytoene desaturase [Kineosporiaceae bacterium]|nr:phytoene desaturase [Kineosporiaceae bacterium]
MRTVTGPTDHVVIVGAGLAGLSAAMRLAGVGRRVTVLEREPIPGGRAGLIVSPAPGGGEYRFDTGPTVLTMPELIEDCFDSLGESMGAWLDLKPIDPAYRANFADGSSMRVHADVGAMTAEIERVCGAQEAAGFVRYVDAVSRIYRYEMRHFVDRVLDTPWSMLGGGGAANLARLVAIGGLRRLAPFVGSYLKDPRTQRMYSFQALYAGVSPQQALAIYAVISYMDSVAGVYAARGGMHALPQAMADAAAAHGVEFRYGTSVARVELDGKRARGVITTDGERIPADVVVLNPDLPVAYRDLLGQVPARVRRLRYSPSCYLLLAGSRASYPESTRSTMAHHVIEFGRAWEAVFADLGAGRLMADPSLLISTPTLSDPSLAPAGRHVHYVLAPTPNLDPPAGTAPLDWARLAPIYREHVLRTLEARGYHGFADGIEVEHVTTPADWQAQGMAAGTPFAASHTFTQTGPFRPHNLWGENVVFTGSGTQPGVGVPMVLVSGRLAAERICGHDRTYRSRAWH